MEFTIIIIIINTKAIKAFKNSDQYQVYRKKEELPLYCLSIKMWAKSKSIIEFITFS